MCLIILLQMKNIFSNTFWQNDTTAYGNYYVFMMYLAWDNVNTKCCLICLIDLFYVLLI